MYMCRVCMCVSLTTSFIAARNEYFVTDVDRFDSRCDRVAFRERSGRTEHARARFIAIDF